MMNKYERETLKRYLNKEFPKIFYSDGNEEIVFFDAIVAGFCSRLLSFSRIKNLNTPLIDDEINSIIQKNIDKEGVLEYKALLFETVKIIESYIKT